MLLFSRCFVSGVLLTLLAAPAAARRGAPSPSDLPEPGLPDKVLAKKAAVELSKSHVEAAMQALRACIAGSPPVDERKELEADLAPLEAALKDAGWTYDVGNYEEAWRRYGALDRRVKTTQLACDKYWESCSLVDDPRGNPVRPRLGWTMTQVKPGNQHKYGTLVDIDFIQSDARGRLPFWAIAA